MVKLLNFETIVLRTEDGKSTLNLLNKFITYVGSKNYNSSLSDYLESVKENEITFASEPNENACLVTTIHQSKGLEYPVVFLVGAGTQLLNKQALRDFIPSKDLGIGLPYQDIEIRTKSSLLPLNAIKLQTNTQNLEEKLRLLYVALTRAVQNLVVVGFVKENSKLLEPSDAKTFMDWIMPVVDAKSKGGLVSFVDFEVEYYEQKPFESDTKTQKSKKLMLDEPNDNFVANIERVLTYEYPYKDSLDFTAKTSVSELLAKEDGEALSTMFVGLDNSTAIAKGNVYHKFMQTVDFSKRKPNELVLHLKKLVVSGEISEADANLINLEEIEKLLNNEIFIQLARGTVYREQEFISKTNFSKAVQKSVGEDTILQGVVDFISIINGEAYVVDYKTNNFKNEKDYLDKYALQLKLYADVVAESFGVKVAKKLIYSFKLNKFIEVK